MSKLASLKAADSLPSLAALLDFKASALAYLAYHKPQALKYREFRIPKRKGGVRLIKAPSSDLKLLQQRVSSLLQDCLDEISERDRLLDLALHGSKFRRFKGQASHGFVRGRGIISNARMHRNKRYVFNLDLSDFFGSINFGRVYGFLISDRDFLLHPKVAAVLAAIACNENALPQGSPCSPVFSNLIGNILDERLLNVAARQGCTYSRYADDLTFSTNLPEFPDCIARPSDDSGLVWEAGREIASIIERSGFLINPAKTRMQFRDSRQEVTGLVVNKRVNVRFEYRHTLRSMVHRLTTTGAFDLVRTVVDAAGNKTMRREVGSLEELHGMLGFVDAIDINDRKINPVFKPVGKQHRPTSKETIYKRFLLFKEFYVNSRPVIICEGKTDYVYLLHALRSLSDNYPDLTERGADGNVRLKVRLYRYPETSTGKILGISGGVGDLCKLMATYRAEAERFTAPGLRQPVIFVIDNDQGRGPIFDQLVKIGLRRPSGNEVYIHAALNLYVVLTPLGEGGRQTAIEDFFSPDVLSTVVGGKRFDRGSDTDTETGYGKAVFADRVVRANSGQIDFSRFALLFDRIQAVMVEHAGRVAISDSGR